jgi:predicted  nucleic acid-binding Zn-ribbon protein
LGKFEDFVISLDGQTDLSVTDVVAQLHKLHNEEVSIGSAKIQTLTDQLTEKNTALAETESQLKDAKSANWDLVNRIPGESSEEAANANESGSEIDQKRITLDDAFAQ